MAAYSADVSEFATLSGVTVDTVTFTRTFRYVVVHNRDEIEPLFVTADGTTPVADGDETSILVAPNEEVTIPIVGFDVKLIGRGNAYSVTGSANAQPTRTRGAQSSVVPTHENAVAITTGAGALANVTREIYVGTAGTLIVTMLGTGASVTFTMVAGGRIPIRATHVTGGTATGIVGLW